MIVGMTIGARRIRHLRLEIALVVALGASYAAVFSEKRIRCFGVIKAFKLCHLLPVRCVVARLARAFEGALMRICVAARASGEGKPSVFDVRFSISHRKFDISHRRVAFRTGHGGVRSRQRVFRSRVIKPGSRLPALCGMASLAVGAELSPVFILVAASASASESQIGVIEIFYLNSGPARRQDLLSIMAFFATQRRMFAGEGKTRLAMVHRLSTGLPVNEREVHSVVVGVALGTILACYSRSDPYRMHTEFLNETITNFGMAVQAFQLHPASRTQVVAFRAVQNAIERLVHFGQRPGRHLRAGGDGTPADRQQKSSEREESESSRPIRAH